MSDSPAPDQPAADPAGHPHKSSLATLAVSAIGIVFGDIGTSPIYAFRETFSGHHDLANGPVEILGVLSLIFWSMMIVVTLKYVAVIMRADNKGEGGSLALLALINRKTSEGGKRRRWTGGIILLGVFACSLFYGDSMITPAISVLSAVEGLITVQAGFARYVVPIALVILVGLFTIQATGTARVGAFFGPVMVVYFLTISVLGIMHIVDRPMIILETINPVNAIRFFLIDKVDAFLALGSVVLAVTGAEALYADMGHFGRRAITRGWLFLVLPACVLNYLGQGALLLGDETAVRAPFFLLTPDWARVPMVLLATAATVIASQAVITGAYSVASQAAQLGYLPRLRITHTSASTIGQIYVPWINGVLLVSVLTLVFAFRSSAALAYAFGMAVTGTITITTLLFFYIAHTRWGTPLWLVVIGGGALLLVDLMFLAANMTKLVHGAWLPLLIAVIAFTVMTTWQRGRDVVTRGAGAGRGTAARVRR
jgi:KUP system potassium uptake protein